MKKNHKKVRKLESSFTSQAIDKVLEEVKSAITSNDLKRMWENTFPNTLHTTVQFSDSETEPDTFVITGDINAMWLRDSTNQVLPYFPFAKDDPKLQRMLKGVLLRQIKNIHIDTYANAFNKDDFYSPWQSDQSTKLDGSSMVNAMNPKIWERKYEIDSLAAFLRLSHEYYFATKDSSPYNDNWLNAIRKVIETARNNQAGTAEELEKLGGYHYTFRRGTSEAADTTIHGTGSPAKRCGLIKSAFRPSDDSQMLPFHIPGNAMFSSYLSKVADIMEFLGLDSELKKSAEELSKEVKEAIYKHAVVKNCNGENVFAYEVDGFGSFYLMDDANIPSLLSLPYLGFIKADDPLYVETRKFVWSENNPYFFKSDIAEGIGGAHIFLNYIWPMSIAMKGLTSSDSKEVKECIQSLLNTQAGTHFMHESFNKNNPSDFTRSWFAWANSLFGELVLKAYNEFPEILKD